MKTLIIIILLLVPISAQARPWFVHSEENRWTGEDTIRELFDIEIRILDWAQTRHIAKNPDKYFETNKYLGKHPSVAEVDKYFLVTGVLHLAISYALPKKLRLGTLELKPREAWQYVTIGMHAQAVMQNSAIGIQLDFPW